MLHVAVAAGVGDVVLAAMLATGKRVGLWGVEGETQLQSFIGMAAAFALAGIATVLVVAILHGTSSRVLCALLASFVCTAIVSPVAGEIAMVGGGWLIVFFACGMDLVHDSTVEELTTLVFAAPAMSWGALPGFAAMAMVFGRMAPGVNRRRLWVAVLVGALLLAFAWPWAIVACHCAKKPWAPGVAEYYAPSDIFVLSLTGLVGFPLVYAVVAQMFVGAVQEPERAGRRSSSRATRIAVPVLATLAILLIGIALTDTLARVAKRKRSLLDAVLRFHNVARDGDVGTLEKLLAAGVDVNTSTPYGLTALHAAACEGQDGTIEFLIRQGASINAQSQYGDTPLDYALADGHEATATLLRKHGGKTGKELSEQHD